MPKVLSLVAVTLAAGTLTGCVDDEADDLTTTPAAAAGPIAMPVEVAPPDVAGLTGQTFAETRTVTVTQAQASSLADGYLYLRGHALAYRDGNTMTGAKASVQWDSSGWVDLANPTAAGPDQIVVEGLDAIYGGIGGGFRTVRLRVPFRKLCGSATCVTAGDHTLAFRWNGTDGAGSEYRIVELNLRTLGGADQLAAGAFAVDNPSAWTAPLPGAGDVAEGDRLWHARGALIEQPGGAPIIAACSDCHARDGRDLEYFAFSNRSIVTRAVFHGLTTTQGQQIASYIRSHPAARPGRPWNPPYQPGVGRDALGSGWWAAGAGLDAVVPDDLTRIASLLPTNRAVVADIASDIRGVGRPAATTNLRELPIQIQLPDWNSWLPIVHPIDLWGQAAWEGGDGTFAPARVIATPLLSAASGLHLADWNGDGRLDMLTAQPLANRLWLQYVDAGGFPTTATIYVGGQPMAAVGADLDNDGKLDVVSANFASGDLSTRLGDGKGGFGAQQVRASGTGPRALAVGDYNGDGRLDVAVAQQTANRVAIHLGNGAGGLALPVWRAAGVAPVDVAAGDLDGDGRLDLVAASSGTNQALVFLGNGAGGLAAPTALAVGVNPQAVALADLDRDGRLDVITANDGSGTVSIILRTAAGGYRAPLSLAVGAQASDVAVADVDHDGDLDVVASLRSGSIVTITNTGTAAFINTPAVAVAGNPGPLAVADVDLDGGVDAVTASTTTAELRMTPNTRVFDPTVAPSVVAAYADLRARLTIFDRVLAVTTLPDFLGQLAGAATAFIGAGATMSNGSGTSDGYRTTRGTVLDPAALNGYSMELVKRSLAQWVAVKYWEMVHDFDLETLGPGAYPNPSIDPGEPASYGEVLSWPMGPHQVVFPLAPHIMAADRDNFDHPSLYDVQHDVCRDPLYIGAAGCVAQLDVAQSGLKGDYDSTAWYHLQMLLHAGARATVPQVPFDSAVVPVDWPYAMMHVDDLAQRAAALAAVIPGSPSPWDSARYLATMMKAYQMRDNDAGAALTGWSMRDVSPRLLVSNWRGNASRVELLTGLDAYEAGLRGRVASGFLTVFSQVTGEFDVAPYVWPRFLETTNNDRETWWKLDPVEHAVVERLTYDAGTGLWSPASNTTFPSGGSFRHADDMWNAIPLMRQIPGIDPALVQWLDGWAAGKWPGPAATPTSWTTR